MCLTSWLYTVHKYIVLCFISVKVITRYDTVTVRGIKHTEVIYIQKTLKTDHLFYHTIITLLASDLSI